MAGDFRRLVELGMVPALAKEVAACINAGTVSVIAVRRLTETSMIPREIRELRNQLSGASAKSAKRWTEIGVSPRLARELVAQMGGVVPPTLGTLALTGPALTQGVAASGNGLTGATAGSTITLNIAGLTVSGSGTTRTISGTPATSGALTATETLVGATGSPKDSALGTVAAAGTPAPVFSVQPSMTPTSGTAGSTLFTASDGAASNTTTYTRRWLLSGTAIGTGTTITPASAGSLVLEVTATGPGGATIATSAASTVSAAALTLAQKGNPSVFYNNSYPVNLVESTPGVFSSSYAEATFANTGTMYYVATTGSDANDGLSSGAAKLTLQSAVDAAATGSRITVGAGRFAPPTIASKNLTFYLDASTYIGAFVAEAAITWGSFASGRQTATLASGTVSGFVDTTLTKRGAKQVSRVATSAAGIATWQAGGDPGVFRSTPSQVGSADARNLSGKADSEIIVWSSLATAPLIITGTSQVFVKGGNIVGGADLTIPTTARLVLDSCNSLGSIGQNIAVSGIFGMAGGVVRNCGITNQDAIDYASTGAGFEVGIICDQGCNIGAADDGSTAHGAGVLRINSQYYDAYRAVDDGLVSRVGEFGCTYSGYGYHLSQGVGEKHVAGATFIGTTINTDLIFTDTSSASPVSRVYVYDSSFTGKTRFTGANSYAQTDRAGAKDTSDATFFLADPSSLSSMFQTAGNTVPVTAPGQTVTRIYNPANLTEFMELTAGTATYQTDGTLFWIDCAAVVFKWNLIDTDLDDATNLIWAIRSSDTAGTLLNNANAFAGSAISVGDYRSSLPLTTTTRNGIWGPGTPLYTVDGALTSVGTTATALKAAAFNGSSHIISALGTDLSYVGWKRALSMLSGFDGRLYRFEASRATNQTNLRARQTVAAGKSGVTLV